MESILEKSNIHSQGPYLLQPFLQSQHLLLLHRQQGPRAQVLCAPCILASSSPQAPPIHWRLAGKSSQARNTSLILTVLRGRGHLEVLPEDTHWHMGALTLWLLKKGRALSRSLGLCWGRGRGICNDPAAPAVLVHSGKHHSEGLSCKTAGCWRTGLGAMLDSTLDISFCGRANIHAGTLRWSILDQEWELL